MIGFHVAPYVGNELEYMKKAVDCHHICGGWVVYEEMQTMD